MNAENPMLLRCQNCGLIVEPGEKLLGVECSGCGGSKWATHRETPVCDFCCSEDRPVVASYPADDFNVPMPADTVTANSRGYWTACADCRSDIDAGNREALAERSADGYVQKKMPGSSVPRPMLVASIRNFHDQFWSHRNGPGIPIRQEDA